MTVPVPAELRNAQERFARPDALSFIAGARMPRGKRRAAVLILLSELLVDPNRLVEPDRLVDPNRLVEPVETPLVATGSTSGDVGPVGTPLVSTGSTSRDVETPLASTGSTSGEVETPLVSTGSTSGEVGTGRPSMEYDLVLIEKRADLRSHAGQVAFPGGSIESIDVDPVAAALREANEEVGVEPSTVEVLGVLPAAHIPRSGFDVTSVVGWWNRPVQLAPVDVAEIAAVHQVPVARLLDPANRTTWVHPAGFSGPAFVLDDLYVWGFTAYLLDGMFELLGWTVPWDASRTSEIPPRFLSERL